MNFQKTSLQPGLYLVATPLGTARDITLRALDVLASADVIAAEDTRSMRRLLDIHGVKLDERPLVAYHDHSSVQARGALLEHISKGRSVAYASEAGMPLIADPGYHLVRDAQESGYLVTSSPGATAATTALALSGMASDAFFFAGFLPNSSNARKTALSELRDVPGTLIFYESPKRLAAMLRDAAECLGPDREAAVGRELTKKFEEVRRSSLTQLAQQFAENPPKGEIVVLVERGRSESVSEIDIENELKIALEKMRVRDAADLVANAHGLKRRDVYQLALRLQKGRD